MQLQINVLEEQRLTNVRQLTWPRSFHMELPSVTGMSLFLYSANISHCATVCLRF